MSDRDERARAKADELLGLDGAGFSGRALESHGRVVAELIRRDEVMAAQEADFRASLAASQVEVERLRASLEVTTVQRDALQASLGMGLSAMSSACAADLARERESRLQGEAGARAQAFREARAELGRLPLVTVLFGATGVYVDAKAVRDTIERLASSASTTGAHFERERTYDQILVALRLAGFDAAAAKVSEWKAISDRFPENASTSTAPTGDEPLCRCGHSRAEHNAVYSTPYNCVAGRKCLCGFFAAPTGEPAKGENDGNL